MLQNSDQSVVRARVDDAVAFRQGSHIKRRQAASENGPAPRIAVVDLEAISKQTGKNVVGRHEHGVRIDLEGRGGSLEGLKTPGAV